MIFRDEEKTSLLIDISSPEVGSETYVSKRSPWRASPASVSRLCRQTIRSFFYAFVPQLLRTTVFNDPLPLDEEPSSSAWMNGLRGLASFAVFNEHYVYNYTYTIVAGWGTNESNKWLHQLPVFYMFNDGNLGVLIFFTIGGYVSSYKSLQHMTARDPVNLFKSLPGSVFRKWFRLYLPVLCSTFAISITAYLGLFEYTRPFFNKHYFPGSGDEPQPQRFPTLYLQLNDWMSQMAKMMNFWIELPKDPRIDYHLWTIVYEFRSTMQLFVVLLALATCRPRIRITLLLLSGYVNAFHLHHWEQLAFCFGAVLAQMDILRKTQESQSEMEISTQNRTPLQSHLARGSRILNSPSLRTFGYCIAIYLSSYPCRGDKYGGGTFYKYTVDPILPASFYLNKRHKWPKQLGVLLFMSLILTIPAKDRAHSRWMKFLTQRPVLYLGKVMFAFYLTHGLLLHLFGYAIPILIWRNFASTWGESIGTESVSRGNNAQFLFGIFVGWTINFVVCLWVADVWTREVEARCVRLTKWLENFCFEKGEMRSVAGKVATIGLPVVDSPRPVKQQ